MAERRLIRAGDLSKAKASNTATIPLGGGAVTLNINVSGLSGIEVVLSLYVKAANPPRQDIYAPIYDMANVTGNTLVGITIGAATGTTVTVEGLFLGY